MIRACLLLTALFSLWGCKASLRSGVFKCDAQHACPSGFSCDDSGVCVEGESSNAPSKEPEAGVAGQAADAADVEAGSAGEGEAGSDAAAADGGETAGAGGAPEVGAGAGAAGSGGASDAGMGGAGAGAAGSGGAGAGSAGSGGASGAGMEPEPDAGPKPNCQPGETRACYDGPAPTRGRGSCKDGQQLCESGDFGRCLGAIGPAAESCNGLDDDCDASTDEGTDVRCYPAGVAGCEFAGGVYDCKGQCALGKQFCRSGKLSACEGASTPGSEVCTSSGSAVDEDCDGQADEMCQCRDGEPRACYSGPPGSAGVGICRAGQQSCVGGLSWTECSGAVVPQLESCANLGSDDDCDSLPDNVANLNAPCADSSEFGVCAVGTQQCQAGALVCVTPAPGSMPEVCNGSDDDCDQKTDETVNFNTDPNNCGSCGMQCGAGTSCCGGACSSPVTCLDGSTAACVCPCLEECRGGWIRCGRCPEPCPLCAIP